MNRKEFINVLKEKTKCTDEQCITINRVLEESFIFNKKNKKKIINELMEKIDVSEVKAEEIYNISLDILHTAIKDKIKHPFKSKN